jgi:hypothetical protein
MRDYTFLFKKRLPTIRVITTNTRNMKNITLAIDAAPAAIPVKPKRAAIKAITRNTTVHLNMTFFLD